ncbi:hypothetical protein ACFWYW_27595 [Nonomuraea sp. NPDC059023]|uniref:hypothetical protein n=1 Tax=unclassified Nonomuraea TaxID=2593643 RepID=UPI00369E5B44
MSRAASKSFSRPVSGTAAGRRLKWGGRAGSDALAFWFGLTTIVVPCTDKETV